jgi:hypothetical protein
MTTATPANDSSRPRLLPGRNRNPERLPHQRRRRTRRILAQEGVFDAIVSLAGLLGRPVRNQQGQDIGRLEDVVARWADGQVYPPVSGLVIRVGRRPDRPRRGVVAVVPPRPARRRAPPR